MDSSSSFSSSSRNWVYDVFPSFSGEDVRVTFLSHFLKELDRKLIIAFKDNKIERSQSLDPELKLAIRTSRIAVVVLSEKYASSGWCLNELLEIMRCKENSGQLVIPIFYRLDPCHVRKQTGEFGKIFDKTCKNISKEVENQWRNALTDVGNLLGYHSVKWGNEARMIEAVANDVLGKLSLDSSKDFENFIGIEDHIFRMSELLDLESKEVKMVGIWGSSGIGKTTIARVLFNRLSRHFQGSVYVDRFFVSKTTDISSKFNPDDLNMKLHLQENFLCRILDKQGIIVDHLGAVRDKLENMKVLIFIDDLKDQVVLDTLAGGTQWFGRGSRIIAITEDKNILTCHGIECIYEVGIPSKKVALKMFCQSAFRQDAPLIGFVELATQVVEYVGSHPLGLNLLGSSMRGKNKKHWEDMLPTLRKGLDGKIEKALRDSYDALERKEHKALFRHIACFFNGDEINNIKLMLEDSELSVDISLEILVDKSLIRLKPSLDTDIIEMHSLLEEMGKEIVRTQSDEPGEWEYLIDTKKACDVLEDTTGTRKVIGISLDIDKIDELRIHKEAFKGMRNLRFLNIYTNKWNHEKKLTWQLQEGFDYFPPTLRLLRLDGYPMKYLPSNFRPVHLVTIKMQWSKLEKLWDGVQSLTGLRNMDLFGSENLVEIPDLSKATNLKKLVLSYCSSLVELPSSIKYLNKLEQLHMLHCKKLESLPSGINLRSLYQLNLRGCSRLKSFPDISTNIEDLDLRKTAITEFPTELRLENLVGLDMYGLKSRKTWKLVQPLTPLMSMLSPSLVRLELSNIPSLVELPFCIKNFSKLEYLSITGCRNLKTLPTRINLQSLDKLDLSGCSRLWNFPDISTNISHLTLKKTGIEEVPWWIENFSKLRDLDMKRCKSLQRVSLNISKMIHLLFVDFSNCWSLTEVSLDGSSREVAMRAYNIHSSLRDEYSPRVELNLINCFNLNKEALLRQPSVFVKDMRLSGEKMPSYFKHRTTGISTVSVPLCHTFPHQPFFKFKACVMVYAKLISMADSILGIHVCCRLTDRLGNYFDSADMPRHLVKVKYPGSHLVIFDCRLLPKKDKNALREVNYDRVDIQFKLNSEKSEYMLRGCGIRLYEDSEICNDDDDDLDYETAQSEEYEDYDNSDLGNETDVKGECPYSDDIYLGNEIDQSDSISAFSTLSHEWFETSYESLDNDPQPSLY